MLCFGIVPGVWRMVDAAGSTELWRLPNVGYLNITTASWVPTMLGRQCSCSIISRLITVPVWPDLAKFRPSVYILKVFGNSLRVKCWIFFGNLYLLLGTFSLLHIVKIWKKSIKPTGHTALRVKWKQTVNRKPIIRKRPYAKVEAWCQQWDQKNCQMSIKVAQKWRLKILTPLQNWLRMWDIWAN